MVFGVHPDLRRHLLVTSVASAAVGVAGLFALAVAWQSPSAPPFPLLVFGGASLFVAYIGLIVAPRWYRRASRLVASTCPAAAQIMLHLEADSESTSLYAALVTHSVTVTPMPPDKFLLVMPRWPVDSLLGAPIKAKIYRDPQTQRPVAFQITNGFLWCLPHSRAA